MCRARLGSKAAATARPGEPRPARTSGRALQDGSGSARARLGLSRSPQVPAGALSRPPSCTARAQRPATRRVGGRVSSLTTSSLPSPAAQHEEERGDASSDVTCCWQRDVSSSLTSARLCCIIGSNHRQAKQANTLFTVCLARHNLAPTRP
ncbi:hypothetical protein OH76DRAFT_662210 [Lentinus brumalis]|uniref:Uncharacterized protein n=1 Tax=Lentinus brumalis TaxID=2498619 RepID=A0A371D7P8_9APHY|nr:hypothetical protein OH76DRAFT_662210 [Polyporus brumalis]